MTASQTDPATARFDLAAVAVTGERKKTACSPWSTIGKEPRFGAVLWLGARAGRANQVVGNQRRAPRAEADCRRARSPKNLAR